MDLWHSRDRWTVEIPGHGARTWLQLMCCALIPRIKGPDFGLLV